MQAIILKAYKSEVFWTVGIHTVAYFSGCLYRAG